MVKAKRMAPPTRTDYAAAAGKVAELIAATPGCTSWSGRLYLVGKAWKQFFELAACEVESVRAVYYHPDGGMDVATDYMRHLIAGDIKTRDGGE